MFLNYFTKMWIFFLYFSVTCADCWRSPSKDTHRSNWHYRGLVVDAIDFQTNADIILQGYRLWGVGNGSTSFQVTIQLYRASTLIEEKTGTYATTSSVKTFKVYFSRVISIRAGITYTATARITTNTTSFALTDGISSALCSGVTFTFEKSSKDSNGSDASYGQIPAFIFGSPQC